ncbi:MAG: DUF4129 domain-containing protein [Pirellulales bacterium]|nr:DUF4129 domain-containing protein [Pirellulales bacterium]
MARLDKTLADYVGIAISPVLIMGMVGSLVFFLMELFYQGQYGERLHFILALFVMAIVLVARLSIEFGSEHATMYGTPLAIVTALALLKFVDHGFFINIGLMALIWWSAHKLTWDCTLIDETEDASGEGLLQSAGLEEAPETSAGALSPEAIPGREPERRPASSLGLWHRIRERFSSKGPHAPGVWIVYFSLAALPLFAVGELFLPRSNPEPRRYAFHLLFLYVACGLALLLMTSFLGLRRYLRQRQLQMPPAMARSWIALGCTMVAALVLLAALLPRPSADYDSSNIRLVFDSPEREASDHAMIGNEGGKGEGASGGAKGEEKPAQSGQGRSDEQGESQKTGQSGRPQPSQSSAGKPSGEQSQASEKQNREPSQSQQPDGQHQGQSRRPNERPEETQSERQVSDQGQQQQGERRSQSQQSDAGKQSDSKPRPESGQKAESDPKAESGQNPGNARREKQEPTGSKPDDHKTSQQDGQRSQEQPRQLAEDRSEEKDRQPDQSDQDSPQQEQPEENSQTQSAPRQSRSLLPRIELGSGWWVTLFRWLLYAVLAAVALVWAWRNRQTVFAAIGGMLQALRDLWNRLFGGAKPEEKLAEPEPVAKGPPPRRFADYSDPFATAGSPRIPPDELVRYTFEAVEAWARDHGFPRQPDQTPHEFARAIAAQAPQLDLHARRLAELYSQAAYAPGTLPRGRVSPLRELWRELQRADATPQPQTS